ncbi:MAG: hypothetical protein MUC65_01050 [Pontiellaceae bacterium]|jgi:hypothetical protein|nr:hypothetical protein [Pontiellaceae bacterium]
MNLRVIKSNDQNLFQRLEKEVYSNDPFFIPAPFQPLTGGTGFVAYEDDRAVACCSARLQVGNPAIGTLGHFQALDKPEAVKRLIDATALCLKEQGAQRIIGPMDGDTWHAYRLNTGPFNMPPFIKEPWNPPYYPALFEAAGFSVIETYESSIVDHPDLAAANQEKFYTRCIKHGYTFEPITAKNYTETLPLIHQLSCLIFKDNTLYTAVDLEEFLRMYLPAKPLLQTGLSWMAYAPDKTPAGYVFTFPDYADALRAMKGKTNVPAKLRFLYHKRKATRTCIKTLGAVPEKRGSGLTAALTYLSYKNSAALGYKQTLMCLMHSSNDSRRFGGNADRHFRSYALYELFK